MRRWCVGDVMTTDVAAVGVDTGYKEIADLLVARSVSAVPVVDAQRRVIGVVSEADLLAKLQLAEPTRGHPLLSRRRGDAAKAAGDTAAELMTSPAATIRSAATVSRAARLMEAAHVKRLPVVDDDGRLIGVVSRRDLVRLYAQPDETIRDCVRDVLRALWVDLSTIEVRVDDGIVTLGGTVDRRSTAAIALRFTQAVPGVVDVADSLAYDVDDGAEGLSRPDRSRPVEPPPQAVEAG
jgi:CBS-domain-containing membrane protein